ncbi:cell envelope biogenesis protein TolA [Sphingomonas canadensis]|nr:cell envelope biogenesis protein TolA [Sphingomonas canadensis]
MSRGEVAGLAVAGIGHAALFALLAIGFLSESNNRPPPPPAMEVSLVDKVGLEQMAPVVSTEPEAAKKSELDAPIEPEPAPPEPDPKPVTKPDPPKPQPKPDANAAERKPERSNSRAGGSGSGNRSSGGLPDYAAEFGRGNRPNDSRSTNPPATMTGEAAANIASAIIRQVQPCANRQVSPGPGAERIQAVVRLQLNRDGSLAAPVQIVGHNGVDDSNERYVRRVDDAVKAIFASCSPLRGLPAELYDVTRGWKTFRLNYRLKG